MARDIPETYNKPDPDRSFVPGTGKIDYGTGSANPPHGPADLADALRHLFGYGAACVVIPQMWNDEDACAITAAGFGGTAAMQWRIAHDEAFGALRLTIDYRANVALTPAFRFKAVELNKTKDLNTVDAAGAVRRVTFDWTVPGMDRTYGNPYHTIELYAQGDGIEACDIVAAWVERLPIATPIAPGLWYTLVSSFETPDSTAFSPDKPLTADKGMILIKDILQLHEVRLKCYLNWSAVIGASIPAEGLLSVLAPLRPDDNGLSFGWILQTGESADMYGGRDGQDSDARYHASEDEAGWKSFDLRLESSNPLIRDRQSLQHIVIDPAVGPYLGSIALFGN